MKKIYLIALFLFLWALPAVIEKPLLASEVLDRSLAEKSLLCIRQPLLDKGIVSWERLPASGTYILEQSLIGAHGPWATTYQGVGTSYSLRTVRRSWYRVRFQALFDTAGEESSDFSLPAEYSPPVIAVSFKSLRRGVLRWKPIAQADAYEVEYSASAAGPWDTLYRGPYRNLKARAGRWYRIRACSSRDGSVTPWSRPQTGYPGFLTASGTSIREQNGTGTEIVLKGFNLGNLLLIEPWMTGIGEQDGLADEHSIREVLNERFGEAGSHAVLSEFRRAYASEADFDRLAHMGVNVVRLPVYYRLLMDEHGSWVRDGSGAIDFSELDRIVDSCADRGIYVLLDLHGAPGSQSQEFHTGRARFNRLFRDTREGERFRSMTVSFWKTLARHYRNNPWVCGYDLLNEPLGSPGNAALWKMYDRLYRAIRAVDKRHIIMMEGAWDWNTLPRPRSMGWENVVYQFHYYLWNKDNDPAAHKRFIDRKARRNRAKSREFAVPVMIGEFSCFGSRAAWDHYLQTFEREGFSWTVWGYKCKSSPSGWGLFNHSRYADFMPSLKTDPLSSLLKKFRAFSTGEFHSRNEMLAATLIPYFHSANRLPFILGVTTVSPGEFVIRGGNFGAGQAGRQVLFDGLPAMILDWTDTSVRVRCEISGPFGTFEVRTGAVRSNEVVAYPSPARPDPVFPFPFTGQPVPLTGIAAVFD